MSGFAHGAGDAARLAWGNRATVYALHLEYSGANFATAEFPANGSLREEKTTAPLEMPAALIQVSAR
jgi:hypothetical protein